MRAGRAVVAAVAAWLAVVALGSAIVWAVISRAGEDLVSGRPQPDGYSSAGQAEPSTLAPGEPIKSRRPTKTPSRSAGPTGDPSATPGGGSQTPPAAPSSSPGAPVQSSAPPADPVTRDGSRSVVGGTVFASCKGAALTSASGVPNAGYRLEREQGAGWAEVKFESSATGREITVRVTCSGGYPRFTVEDDGSDEDDGD